MAESDDEAQQINNRIQLFEQHLESLTEKRTSTREEAFESILKDLRTTYDYELLDKRKVTLLEAVKKGLKKGSVKEQQLSSDVLALIFITLGADSEEIYKDIRTTLEELINNSTNKELDGPLINAFSIACFIGNPDETTTHTNLDFLHSIFSSDAKKIASIEATEAALKGWGLLLTTVPKRYIYDFIIPNNSEVLVDYLRSEDVDVRVAAGECLALIFEAARTIEGEKFNLHSFGNDYGISTDDLLDTLYGLMTDKTKSRAKKDKSKQRVPFKEIKNYIESGEEPIENLVFKFQKFNFSGWTEITQLNALRDILGEGLQSHFETNTLVHQIFDLVLDKNAKKIQLSAVEKRLYMSPSSSFKKASTKSLNKQRNEKQVSLDFSTDD